MKYRMFAVAAAMAFFLTGCAKDKVSVRNGEATPSVGAVNVTIKASLGEIREDDGEEDTKIVFDPSKSLTLAWEGGETLYAFACKMVDGILVQKRFTLKGGTGESMGVFTGTFDFADSGLTMDDVKIVIMTSKPSHENFGVIYDGTDMRLSFPANQYPAASVGTIKGQYISPYAMIDSGSFVSDGEGGYTLDNVILKPGQSLLRTRVYDSSGTYEGLTVKKARLRALYFYGISAVNLRTGALATLSGTVGGVKYSRYALATETYSSTPALTAAKDGAVELLWPWKAPSSSSESVTVCWIELTLSNGRVVTKYFDTTGANNPDKGRSKKLAAGSFLTLNIDMSPTQNAVVDPDYVPQLPYLTDPYSSVMHYSTGRLRTTTAVMQSFDIDDENGDIYYSQLNNQCRAYLMRSTRNNTSQPTDFMTVYYTGHVSNFTLEVGDDGYRYFWLDNFASKNSNAEYWSSPVVSRIKFVPGTVMNAWEATENYYFGEKNISVAVDIKGDMLTILGISSGNFRTYRLSELRALPIEDITLDPVTYGGESVSGIEETTKAHTIKARDCTSVTPLGTFHVDREVFDNGSKVSWQGFDISDGKVYQAQGNGFADGNPSVAWLQVRKIDGTVVLPLTKIAAIDDLEVLNSVGLTDTGYMEAEGVKVLNDCVMVGFANKNSENVRMGTLFRFDKNLVAP